MGYEADLRATVRATARPVVTRQIASNQNTTRRPSWGEASPVIQVSAWKIQVPSVTTRTTPTISSTVEWSARSSSRS